MGLVTDGPGFVLTRAYGALCWPDVEQGDEKVEVNASARKRVVSAQFI